LLVKLLVVEQAGAGLDALLLVRVVDVAWLAGRRAAPAGAAPAPAAGGERSVGRADGAATERAKVTRPALGSRDDGIAIGDSLNNVVTQDVAATSMSTPACPALFRHKQTGEGQEARTR
jgi:hypothetical protein